MSALKILLLIGPIVPEIIGEINTLVQDAEKKGEPVPQKVHDILAALGALFQTIEKLL